MAAKHELERDCDQCEHGRLVLKEGRRGAFLGCDRFPSCRRSLSLSDAWEPKASRGRKRRPPAAGTPVVAKNPKPARDIVAEVARVGFVRTTDGRIGRLLGSDGATTVRVGLLEDPGQGEVELSVSSGDVNPYELPRGTEVWVEHVGGLRSFGTVRAFEGDGYLVRLGERDAKVSAAAMTVWAGGQTFDPVGALSGGYIDSLAAYKARVGALKNAIHQRALFCGLTAAASASVELHRHQLDVVAQVTSDPVCRYVLADEVGMGKTIEAGLVIRQRLLDDPLARVIIAVPPPLVGQWETELRDKLLLGGIFDSRWQVVEHDDLPLATLAPPSLLVIDEAHQVAERALVEAVEAELAEGAAQAADGLLLLTATPVRGNAEVFHYLLHLLDPSTYPRDDVESFRQRLERRYEMAATIELLADDGMPWDFLVEDLKSFTSSLANDQVLQGLLAGAISGGEADRSLLTPVVDHLREHYRVSRRVLRNQRTAATDFPVLGRWFDEHVPLEDSATAMIDDFVDRLRELVADDTALEAVFAEVVDAAMGGPVALQAVLASVEGLDSATRSEVANFMAKVGQLGIFDRVNVAVDFAARWWSSGKGRLLVATGYTATANELVDRIVARVGDQSVRAHTAPMNRSDRDKAIAALTNDDDPARILVIDRTGEEGRNLQFSDVVLHVDVPLSVNRLEQRIGRVDRFGRGGAKKKRNVVVRGASHWEVARDRLHEASGVLESSVATLQRPLALVEREISQALVAEGVAAIDAIDLEAFRSRLDAERQEVARLEEIETSGARKGLSNEQFRRLDDFEDGDWGSVRNATIGLTSRHGLHLEHRFVPNGQEAIFTYRKPTSEVAQQLGRASLERLAKAWDRRRTFNRAIAVRDSSVVPVRVGDPLFDELIAAVRRGQRARTRALLRSAPGIGGIQAWFQFDVLVEFSVAPDLDVATSARIGRVGDRHLAPVLLRRWSDGNVTPDDEFESEFLRALPTGKPDVPVGPEEWSRLQGLMPDLHERVHRAAEQVVDSVTVGGLLEARRGLALENVDNDLRSARYVAGHFGESGEVRRYLAELEGPVRRGIAEPHIEIVAVGAYFLLGTDA